MLAVATAGVVLACGGVGTGELVDYVEGDWHCESELPDQDPAFSKMLVDVTVSAADDDSGTFTYELRPAPAAVGAMVVDGEWELDGDSLELSAQMTRPSGSPFPFPLESFVEGVELGTDHIALDDGESPEPLEVDVERRGRTVVFTWPDEPNGVNIEMACTKQ